MATNTLRFQLQYNFTENEKHSLDAFITNDNEKDFLLTFKEVIKALDLDIHIESEALSEGSLKKVWKFIGADEKQLKLVGGALLAFIRNDTINCGSSKKHVAR